MAALRDVQPPPNGGPTVGTVIAEFLRAAEATESDARVRELRTALGHVDAELGSAPFRALRRDDVTALLGGLRSAGLSVERERAIVEALQALQAFASESRRGGPPALRAPRDAMVALGSQLAVTVSVLLLALVVVVLAIELA